MKTYCLLFTPAQPAEQVQRLAEACYRFTPRIVVRAGEAVFLDLEASLHLFREERMEPRFQALSRRFGLPSPRIARHRDAAAALACARYGGTEIDALPLEALLDYASPFAGHANEGEPPAGGGGVLASTFSAAMRKKPKGPGEGPFECKKACTLLRGLGFTRLGDLARLPRESLASRFGEEGVRLVRWTREGCDLPWPSFRLPERVLERLDLYACDTMAPCSELEPLLFATRAAIDRAMARLRARWERAARIRLSFELESRTADRVWEIDLPIPQGSAQGLLPILRDRLGFDLQRRPLDSPVTSIAFEVEETAPGRGAQRDFFNRKEEENEAWEALVGRLERRTRKRTGATKAFLAIEVDRHQPESCWRPAEWTSHPPPPRGGEVTPPERLRPERPSRLLRRPEKLTLQEGGWLVGARRRWRAAQWHGPERISGEWWATQFERDYYRVVTDEGAELWVFFRGDRLKDLRLHGYFD